MVAQSEILEPKSLENKGKGKFFVQTIVFQTSMMGPLKKSLWLAL